MKCYKMFCLNVHCMIMMVMCKTCDGALIKGNIPAQAEANGLKLPPIPQTCHALMH